MKPVSKLVVTVKKKNHVIVTEDITESIIGHKKLYRIYLSFQRNSRRYKLLKFHFVCIAVPLLCFVVSTVVAIRMIGLMMKLGHYLNTKILRVYLFAIFAINKLNIQKYEWSPLYLFLSTLFSISIWLIDCDEDMISLVF
ncbi:hypothetical protein ACJX0J_020442 [Zea mays]